jgi:hypothetical protein
MMKRELEHALVQEFPRLFRERLGGGDTSPLAQRGIEVGDGWGMLLRRLAVTIEPLLAQTDFYFTQVKEKWGRLTIYFTPGLLPDAVEQALTEARQAAARTCEQCGAPGVPRRVPIQILCDPCAEIAAKRRLERVRRWREGSRRTP